MSRPGGTLFASLAFGAATLFPMLSLAGTVFDRDAAFGNQGTADVWFDAGQQNKDAGRALLRRADGDIDVIAQVQIATTDRYGVGLQRMTPGGTRVGITQVIATPQLSAVVDAVRTQDGKIVVLGRRPSDANPSNQSVVVMRLDAGYVLDPTFDGIGWRSYDIVDSGIPRSAFPRALVSLASGDIVVIGDAYANSTTWSLKLVLAQNGSVRRSCSADTSLEYTSLATAALTVAGSADDVLLALRQRSTGALKLSVESADSGSCGASNGQITIDVPTLCPHSGAPTSASVNGTLLRTDDASTASASYLLATGTDPPFDEVRAAVIDINVTASGGPSVQWASCGLGDISTTRLAQSDNRQQVFLTGWRCAGCVNGITDTAAAVLKRSGSSFLAYPVPLPFQGVPGFQRQTSYFDAGTYRTAVIATPGLADSFVLAGTRTLGSGPDDDVVTTRHGLVPAMFENGFE